jgi:transcription antitermination factor NusG
MRAWSEVLLDLQARHRAQTGPRWHLVQVAAGERDRRAVEWLRLRGFEPYYPQVRLLRRPPLRQVTIRQRRLAGRIMRAVLEPMFRRYVFARFDPQRGWRDILWVAGVMGIACEAGRPVPIADDLIDRLRAAEVDGAIPGETPASEVFRLGQLVEVCEGPLAPFRGEVEKIRVQTIGDLDMATRVTVCLEIFGRLTPVELDSSHLTPVNLSAIR